MSRKTGSRDNSASKPRVPLVRPPKPQTTTVKPGPVRTFLGGLDEAGVRDARRYSEMVPGAGEFGTPWTAYGHEGITSTGLWDPIFD